jgi:hypothetical protein
MALTMPEILPGFVGQRHHERQQLVVVEFGLMFWSAQPMIHANGCFCGIIEV